MQATLEKAERLRLREFERHQLPVQPRILTDRQGREIYALDSGGNARPVLFVHGGGGEAGQWVELAAAVRDVGHRVVLVDRPGHGLSYPIEYGGFDYRQAAAEFLEDVVDALKTDQVDIVANSMGGFFSLAFALARPERIRRLVLIGAPAGVDRYIPFALRLLAFAPFNRILHRFGGPTDVASLRKLYGDLLVSEPEQLDDDFLQMQLELSMTPKFAVAYRTLLEEFVSLRGCRHLIREEVASLPVKTTFIWGDEDAFAPPSSGRDLATRMPDATLRVVPDAGHLPWLDEPATCADAVIDAIQTSDAGREAA